nr:ABC transporter ATP-binding protein [uncultured Merdimonas sp.]
MKKLFGFLKPYAAQVLVIVCVLVIQAYCDLSLPSYTSDIVNVGIQQSGIDEKVPETLSSDDLTMILAFVSKDDQKDVAAAYEEGGKDDEDEYAYHYDGTVMVLKESVKEDAARMDKLADQMDTAMVMAMAAESSMSGNEGTAPNAPEAGSADMSAMENAAEQMADLPESMVEQAVAAYIQNAYEKIGIDVGKISSRYILATGGRMLALAGVGMLASILVGLMASRVGAGLGRGLRKDVFHKVVGFSNGEFDKFSTASLITRSTNDIQQIQLLTVMILRMVLYAPILAVGGVWNVFHTNVDMSWIIALAVVLIFLLVAVLFAVVMPKFRILQNLVDRLNLVSREILTGLSVIRAFDTEKHEEKRFDEANRDLTKANLFVNRAMTFMMPSMMLIMNGISVLIVWVGGHSIDEGTMQVGDMMAFIQYTLQIIMAFLMICMISVMLPRAAVSAERVSEVLDSHTLINDPDQPETLETADEKENKGEITFDHVSFRYPGAEEDVLHDISFTARPGQTTAVIGSTGSGKSTLVNLIPRFYDVTEGSIQIDGHDIRNLRQHDLREMLGYVPQKGVLFSGDIASNILFGNPEGSEEEMEEAARIAQATEFIENKKQRYKSHISQGGSNVSGGQKQRLSIARAIAKHPAVYIFDDSFSALDYKTDVTLRNALKEKTADSTVIIVAQRISTIRHAEQILVLDDGKIVGKGTHQELLRNCEEYYQIASSQLSEKELSQDMKEVG